MYFNTSGACKPRLHYMLPAIERLPEARDLIDQSQYFVIHAPRQSGKTTILNALVRELNAAGDRVALYVSCEFTGLAGENYEAEVQLLGEIRDAASAQDYPDAWLPPTPWPEAEPGRRFLRGLRTWARRCPVPIVLLIDEIDTLTGIDSISVLRQLRAGFQDHPDGFPASVVLCGMRNVRDYKAASGGNPDNLRSGSPFNIAVESLTLADFTRVDIAALYAQHTTATGQEFTTDAMDSVFHYTAGQPWLVNALAREITEKMGVPPAETITGDHVERAVQRLIAVRGTHLDSLVARLYEPRVQRVIEPIITGADITTPNAVTFDDDLTFVADLGLVNPDTDPISIANPIYHEVISRLLARRVINAVHDDPRSFLLPDGRVDLNKLLREFLGFWREQGELMASGDGYNEAGAQLVLLGYLYRVINGGGLVQSQPGLGPHRVDILVSKPYIAPDGSRAVQREVLELKVWRDRETDPVDQGLDQLDIYLAKLGLEAGTLVIFDRRSNAAPQVERGSFTQETTVDGRKIQILRL